MTVQKMKKVYSIVARDYIEVPDVPPAPPRSRPAISSGREFMELLERSIDETLSAGRSALEQERTARIAAEQRAAEVRPSIVPAPSNSGRPIQFDVSVVRDSSGMARNYRVKETAVPEGQRPVELDVAVERDSLGVSRGFKITEAS